MKPLKLLSMSILIAFALLLSAASNGGGETLPSRIPTPQTSSPAKSPNPERNSEQHHGTTASAVSTNKQNRASPTANQDSKQQQRDFAELTLNRALTLYTGELAVYTFWLVVVVAIASVIAPLQAIFLFASIQEYLRPKVHIRSFNMINDLRTHMQDKAPFRFSLVLVNHGGSRARVKSGNFTIRITASRDIPTFGYSEAAYQPSFKFWRTKRSLAVPIPTSSNAKSDLTRCGKSKI